MRALGKVILWLPLGLAVMLSVLLGLVWAFAAVIWENIIMDLKTIVQCITEKFWPQKKSVMSRERYRELSMSEDLKLTQQEIDEGWFFCCEWDGMLINKEWQEACCCTCLPPEDRPERIEMDDVEFEELL